MKGLHFSFLAGIILVVMVLLVGMAMISTVSDMDVKQYFGLSPLLQDPATPIGPIDPNNGGTTIEGNQIEHIFSPSLGPLDISEIACHIGEKIYADFNTNGLGGRDGTRYTNSVPFESAIGYLVDKGSFLYRTQTGTCASDSAFDNAGYPKCNICKQGTQCITNLDENCINMQLKDRFGTGGIDKFCGPGTIQVGTQRVAFGNDEHPDLNPGVTGWADNSFCDNSQDRIRWFGNGQPSWSQSWKSSFTDTKYNSKTLSNNWNYAYGLFWVPDGTNDANGRYDVVFSMLPNSEVHTTTNANDIVSDISDTSFIKIDVLGNIFTEARAVSEFKLTPSTTTNVGQILDSVSAATGTQPSCCSGSDCSYKPSNLPSEFCLADDIGNAIRMDAIEGELGNQKVNFYLGDGTSCTGTLASGKTYKVIINQWINMLRKNCGYKPVFVWGCDSCFSKYDRSVIISEIVPFTITTNGNGLVHVYVNDVFKEDVQGTKNIDFVGVGDKLKLVASSGFVKWVSPGLPECTTPTTCASIESVVQGIAFSITYYFS